MVNQWTVHYRHTYTNGGAASDYDWLAIWHYDKKKRL